MGKVPNKGLLMCNRFLAWAVLNVVLGFPVMSFAQQVDVPADYDTIQEAISALASNPSLGNTVFIAPGIYTENIEISSSITLQGEETARTILSADIVTQPTVSIVDASNVTVRNLTFDEGDIGLSVTNGATIVVKNNVFSLDDQAIAVTFDLASSAEVTHNVFYDNDRAVVRESDQIVIRNNIFSENNRAIVGDGAQVEYNCFYNNELNGVNGFFSVLNANPLFADVSKLDFHLRESSPCMDEGDGTEDVIDNSAADMGAYGGEFADVIPFPVQGVVLSDVSDAEGSPAIEVSWLANNSNFVTHSTAPGGYKLYYDSDQSGIPYAGRDAVGGVSPITVGDVVSYKLLGLSVDSVIPMSPEVTSVQPSNGQVKVSWSAVAGATNYQVHYGVASIDEHVASVGNSLSHTVSGLTNGTTYLFAVKAKAQDIYYVALKAYDSTVDGNNDANESDYSTEVSIDMGAERISAASLTHSAIPELVVPVPDLPDEGCFIATAAFGYYSAPQVQWLRDFRDVHLKRYIGGRFFIKTYYALSPPLAEYVRQSTFLKSAVRVVLTPFVIVSGLVTHWQVNVLIVLLGLLSVLSFFQRRGVFRQRVMQ